MSYNHLVSIITEGKTDYYLIRSDDFNTVEKIALEIMDAACKNPMLSSAADLAALAMTFKPDYPIGVMTFVTDFDRQTFINKYADQHAKLEITPSGSEDVSVRLTITDAAAETIFYKKRLVWKFYDNPMLNKVAA